MKYLLSILSISLCFFVVPVHAALDTAGNSVAVKVNPENPNSGDKVTITLQSYAIDLDASDMVWYVDGKINTQGTGIKNFRITAPQNGKKITVTVDIKTLDKHTYTKNIDISPQDIDLLWEASDSFVPPFYKGKSFPGEQGQVRFVAIPNFYSANKPVDRSKMIYYWKKGDNTIQQSSGFGRNSYNITLDYLTEGDNVEITARTQDQTLSAKKSVFVQPKIPEILIYEANPLLGTIYSKAFTKGIQLSTNETTFVAEPFGFSGLNKVSNPLTFAWTLNGEGVEVNEPNKITVRTPEQKTGISLLKIHITNTEKILQDLSRDIPLKF